MSGSSTALLLTNPSHAELPARERLPAVGSLLVQTLTESCSNIIHELRFLVGGCFGNIHTGSNQGQLSELLVSDLPTFRGEISKKYPQEPQRVFYQK